MAKHIFSTFFTLLLTALMFGAATGPAMASSPHYRAEPATRPAAERLVVRDVVWKCGANGCVAAKSSSRPAIECAALVREVGPVRSFSVAGRTLDAPALEKCNARAR